MKNIFNSLHTYFPDFVNIKNHVCTMQSGYWSEYLSDNLYYTADTYYITDRLMYEYTAGLQCRGGGQRQQGPEGAHHHCGGHGWSPAYRGS